MHRHTQVSLTLTVLSRAADPANETAPYGATWPTGANAWSDIAIPSVLPMSAAERRRSHGPDARAPAGAMAAGR